MNAAAPDTNYSTIVCRYWACHALAEKRLAATLALAYSVVASAVPSVVLRALLFTDAPTWIDQRFNAFVGNWGCMLIELDVAGEAVEFVFCNEPWLLELRDALGTGALSLTDPDCRQAVGFP